jgi:glycine cleavage system regulatory protein
VATLVLTVVGDDRPGLIKALADVVSSNGGNWERSHLAELEGTFAGVVLVSVPDHQSERLQAALAPLDGLLNVSVRPTGPGPESTRSRRVKLELIGNDHPGIVAAVSDVLVRHRLGVADLQTTTREAPMAGGMLFEATAIITVDPEAPLGAVQADLERLASEILVDLTITDLS